MNTYVELPYWNLCSLWGCERRLGLLRGKDWRECVAELSR